MNKVLLFVVAVIIGVFGALIVSNQNSSKPNTPNINFNITPTLASEETIPPTNTVSLAPSISPSITIPASPTATITTTKGDIVLTLYGKEAPNTVNNFIQKAKSGFYNNLTFHRVEDWVIQGGDPKGNGTGGGNMTTELNDKPFVVGSLGVARGGDIKISNDAQFFITKKDASWLNEQYTNFGMVTKGMDVVEKIAIGDKILKISIEE